MSVIEHDHTGKLLHMAGQIADFWRAYPQDQAVEGIATHINKFWTPRMRADFLAACDAENAAVDALLGAARAKIRA